MSNPNDPYEPIPPQDSWGEPDSNQQGSSNDWNLPQQGYGQHEPDGSLMHSQGSSGVGGSGTVLTTDDIVAIVLSAIFPGAGQIMLGQTTKGIVILAVSFVSFCICGIFNVAAAIDAYAVAMAKKKRAVGEWEFFPDLTNKS